ncbi:hypothetical protein OBBRIDRAFT_784195 [Obba rivulosa]|uniref:Bromo domain-containing protein n=1 Tax=Obba rivulosa TaxID=1052685 RepID=A0A8E2DGE6_9APHY|nr:hypothetical protein OBBRIDRAFT_784195 [Obba rivulosa]
MDDIDLTSNDHHGESSQRASRGSGSGLRLVIPPLKTVQALKGKKSRNLTPVFQEEPAKKIPRPVKLKPLKEVLSKLIVQIKKKDDYAFFLQPVDISQVPGYADMIKRPMDLGTMTKKVEKGKYRSLEEFADDLRLVTTNAKTFNPPGTIYYTEAEKIEAWALEHIAKASVSVIEYETDWNIEIERDEEAGALSADDDDAAEKGTPMDVDGEGRGRSPSVASTQMPTPAQTALKRGRGNKKVPGMMAESLEPDGGLPGAKDGLGAFPPGSDLAVLMLALKLRGKRYRSKKERLRMEKGGPPYAADGSLDYAQLEDPFSILSLLVPEPMSRPLLTPLYPSLPTDTPDIPFPGPVNIPPSAFTSSLTRPSFTRTLKSSGGRVTKGKRRHWTISRNAPGRGRVREKDEDEEIPAWKVPREPVATDFGTYSTLVSLLAMERRTRDLAADLGSEERLFEALRLSVENRSSCLPQQVVSEDPTEKYWSGKAREAEEYVRDIVYGGVDGIAYVRSVAEFVSRPEGLKPEGDPPDYAALGQPLACWVEQTVVDPLTDGRHSMLRETALRLHNPHFPIDPAVREQVDRSLNIIPRAAAQIEELYKVTSEPIDMASLIRAPTELFLAEDVWAGAAYKDKRRRQREEARDRALVEEPGKNAADYLAYAIESHKQAEASGGTGDDDHEVLAYALQYSADVIMRCGRPDEDVEMKPAVENEDAPEGAEGQSDEDPELRKLRLNLLALAKRAPLDQIAKLPTDLVPEYIRHVVPTMDS